MEEYNLYCEFDIAKHKAKYVNYLEVLIEKDGHVVYAVPSHQEKAISLAMKKLGVSRDEIMDMCPPAMYCDFMVWVLSLTESVAVWNGGYIGSPNKKQILKLKAMKIQGLYKGKIPAEETENVQVFGNLREKYCNCQYFVV